MVKNETQLPPKEENVKTDTKSEIKQEEPIKSSQAAIEPVTQPAENYLKSKVIRKSESSNTDGFGLVFLDEYTNGKRDTIRILIPNPPPVVPTYQLKTEPKQEDKKFLDIPAPDNNRAAAEQQGLKTTTPGNTVTKNSCSDVASDNDFMKLRKKMAAESTDEGMISEAKKSFKAKCYSTEQVRNLSALFLTASGKYSFFDVSYAHVSDMENFPSLQSELKDEYFINRFKAMLRN